MIEPKSIQNPTEIFIFIPKKRRKNLNPQIFFPQKIDEVSLPHKKEEENFS